MGQYTEVAVLCEDLQQYVFIYHFLIGCGVHPRRIRKVPYPIGQGSAEQFVRQQYPVEVRTYRSRHNRLYISLVAVMDADTQSVAHHFKELDTELTRDGQEKRQPDERIGIFIPKRAIETWIYYLQGKSVNEDERYPHLANQSDCKAVVEALAVKRHQPLPDDALPSLQTACSELDRLF
jgi:hypothetical protein